MPHLPVPRLPPGGSLGIGATLHVGPIRLHIENLECRALKSSHGAKNLACSADFFSACKWGFSYLNSEGKIYIVCLSVESTLNEVNDRSL